MTFDAGVEAVGPAVVRYFIFRRLVTLVCMADLSVKKMATVAGRTEGALQRAAADKVRLNSRDSMGLAPLVSYSLFGS
jgi:hypothetical protein